MPTYDIAQWAQAVALKQYGASNTKILSITGISKCQIQSYYAKAKKHGYNPETGSQALSNALVKNHAQSRCPKRATREKEAEVLGIVWSNKSRYKLTCAVLSLQAWNHHIISAITVWWILWHNGLLKVKPTYKPYLSAKACKSCLKFALEH